MALIPEIRISNYTYDLPEERIAVYPLSERDQSRLLVWKEGEISETLFTHADRVVPPGSLLVFNNTRVIHARLIFHTPSGARIEIFCLEPQDPSDYNISFQSTVAAEWKCLVGNARKWKSGELTMEVPVNGEKVTLKAQMTGRSGNAFHIMFAWNRGVSFATLLEAAGKMPIPPYLNRDAEAIDDDRYQTTYARINGSVAAPTAGLHFTGRVLQKMSERRINTAELTLHVGAGTFQPVKSELVAHHDMHTETVCVTRSFLKNLLDYQGRVIAVGTTSVRSLESLYWLGSDIAKHHQVNHNGDSVRGNTHQPVKPVAELAPFPSFHIDQWQPYLTTPVLTAEEAIGAIGMWMEKMGLDQISFTTAIIILPGYRFRLVHGLFTNFHQPNSTLLLLVAAFLGDDWKKVYDYALRQGFRFLSYGDANLYLKT